MTMSVQQRLIGIWILMLLSCQISFGQISRRNNSLYAVSNIPQKLLKGADVVVRAEKSELTITGIGNGRFKHSYIYTILNKAGEDFANFVVFYDKLTQIEYMRAAVYDANGKFVRKLKKRDIKDYSSADGFSIYTDNRIKHVKLTHNSYPYTIRCEYTTKHDGLLFYQGWRPQTSKKMAVEKSSFTIVSNIRQLFRAKEINLTKAKKTPLTNGKQTWEISNLPAFTPESYKKETAFPQLLLAPNQFEIEGYKGNMKTWQSFGQFMNLLNAKRDKVSPQTIQKLKRLTANVKDVHEKIRIVYDYLQQNTRYVSIQLGIGGWQPFKAMTVDQKGYGDCKALSNFTYTLLKELGIRSHYTLVKAGKRSKAIQTDFPSSQFNHVILCVPTAQDTVWLECTSQRESFGYLGSFTGDRDVLLVTPEGGKVVHTPVYDQNVNTLNRKALVKIAADGNAVAKVKTNYQAIQSEMITKLITQKPDLQKKWLYQNIDIASFELNQFDFKLKKARLPIATETLELKIRKLASKSGKRLFLKPNLMNKYQALPPSVKNRKNNIYISSVYAFTDIDHITYEIPEKYHAEYKPAPIKFSNDFGSYEMQVVMDASKITYIRKMVVNAGTFPKEKYNEMVKFYKKVSKADKEMVVLVSGT